MTNVSDPIDLTGLSADDVPAWLNAALEEAARPATDEQRALALDRAVVAAIRDSLTEDSVLERIDVRQLGRLLERYVARLTVAMQQPDDGTQQLTWELLDSIRRPAVLRRVQAAGTTAEWSDRILTAVDASHLTVGALFRQRTRATSARILFEVPTHAGSQSLTWEQVARQVEELARALHSLDYPEQPARVAILAENSLVMALLDLACLTSGLVDVMVPANATDTDVGYILRHSRVGTVIVSSAEQLGKVERNRKSLPDLRRVILTDEGPSAGRDVMTLTELKTRAERVPGSLVAERASAVRIGDLATVMYTSGTTGTPKGIQYSHRNLVFKRFARALALPEIGDRDVFLCYLPLFHTFGRYLELLGCIFWGAKYCFLLDPSVEALIDGMRRHRPTVFISVPRKWIQLHEMITRKADPLHASDDEIRAVTQDLTGGRLQWGLSAAGYLDPDIFRFYHKQGIQLLSGFGMSEATGGITMTPPFEYADNSLGVPLPGIEVRLGDDGELLIRGPYVMLGYLDPPDNEPSFDADGWLHSGDLMRLDEKGHLRIVDRKKEIYKNVKGQTVAPQRIENLFREFESVGRAFLVGDHREYNTLLIYPNPNYKQLDFAALSGQEAKDHFSSLVVSVNQFVAPFERIVDFAVIERDLSADQGELTPKGTPRRKVVEEHFSSVIDSLYHRASLEIGGVDLTLPNWLFQALGITAQDVRIKRDRLSLSQVGSRGSSLTVKRRENGAVQVGSCVYECGSQALDLGAFLATPQLWLGNEELVGFVPLDLEERQRMGRTADTIAWCCLAEPYVPSDEDRDRLADLLAHQEWNLLDLDHAARMLSSTDEATAFEAVRLLGRVLANEESELAEPARFLLARGATAGAEDVRRRAFQVLVPSELPQRFRDTVGRFLAHDPVLLDAETRAVLCERGLPESKVAGFIALAWDMCCDQSSAGNRARAVISLFQFLAEYGAAHPIQYRRIRAFLVRAGLFAEPAELRGMAIDARSTLQYGFWQWLGPTLRIAVDTETGKEYRWDDVVVFEEETPDEDRRRILSAIKNTPFLREAVFLLYEGRSIRLTDIPPGGVWIRKYGSRHGKTVYRVTIQTRSHDAFELAANVNESLTSDEVQEEIDWLILCGESAGRAPVVEDFGGYAPEQDIWSEEFIPGDTLDRELRRLARRSDEEEGLAHLWPFLAWSALSAFVDIWQRTGRRYEVSELSPSDIVLPTHDYHSGGRIVSLPRRKPHRCLLAMVQSFRDRFVVPVQHEYPALEGLVGWDVIFSSVLEVIGEHDGLDAYETALRHESAAAEELRSALEQYIATVRARGFLPMRLYFASKRYRRWARLNQEATPPARAATLQELYDTYGLDRLAKSYPEVRLRFFRETVFRDSAAELTRGLDDLIRGVRAGAMRNGQLATWVADLRQRLTVEPDDDYFLARIPFAYLRPEDSVDFVSSDLGGEYQSEIVVTLEDSDGQQFRVRHALVPKEVERLHRLFLAANLDVRFGPEHRYLLAISDREQIIGGIYYSVEEGGEGAHLEKIVVADRYRRKGVADGLMREFFNRLRAAGLKTLTTGFFRPEYFYSYGFKIERRYAGLVKELEVEP